MPLSSEEFRATLMGMVHALRVDPYDEVTRLVMADLLEEHNRETENDRPIAQLREGCIPLSALDQEVFWELMEMADKDDLMTDGEKEWVTRLKGGDEQWRGRSRYGMPPPALYQEDYGILWEMAIRYLDQLRSDVIKEEVKAIQADREKANSKSLAE